MAEYRSQTHFSVFYSSGNVSADYIWLCPPPPFLAGKLKPLTPNIFAGFKGPLGGMAKERGKGRKEGDRRGGRTLPPKNIYISGYGLAVSSLSVIMMVLVVIVIIIIIT